jgi:cyclophilin family peptidyl-prolyl cis-trans isomerase
MDLPDGSSLAPRLVAAARAALKRSGPARVFAVRALGRSKDPAVVADLAGVLTSTDRTAAERVEAARALARLGDAGQAALVGALGEMPADAAALSGDGFSALGAAIAAVSDDLPKEKSKVLLDLAALAPAAGAAPPVLRRASALRCAAAAKVARDALGADALRRCDLGDGEAGEKARLAVLERGAWTGARRVAWLELVAKAHLRVREAAIEAMGHHPEIAEASLPVLAEALGAKEPGLVATAAEAIHAHPERVYVLAASERRAALDPRAPAPGASPARELDPRIARAMNAALARPLPPDLIETRAALLDASLAVALPEGRDYALAACKDTNVTMRTRAAKALAAAGEKSASCPAPDAGGDPAQELTREVARPTRVSFETDAGASLSVTFDPRLAPVAATRFIALATAGFYDGVHVHRVVPGFVVQFGDPGGDGYGGSGQTLRCETSPVPFGALDVGVALAGRDTGSSQLFVTLARHPHLDGEYAWVGRAEGDWDAVVEGDVIGKVRVDQ